MRNGNDVVLSPLADPVVSAIFANKDVAGLAAESLIRVTLEAGEQNADFGKIISVTPQRSHSDIKTRGCRVDIEVETLNNEKYIFEVEMSLNDIIIERDIFSAARIFTEQSLKGDTAEELERGMPEVVYINILNFNIRDDNTEALQPFRIMYTKPPLTAATTKFSGYNIQLPRILEMEPDFDSAFYCWFYTLAASVKEKRTIQEVVDMAPQLQTYAAKDEGFKQFCEQYKFVASDPASRHEYLLWYEDKLRDAGRILAAKRVGREEGREEERAKALKEEWERMLNSVHKMTDAGLDDSTIADYLGFPVSEINKYR